MDKFFLRNSDSINRRDKLSSIYNASEDLKKSLSNKTSASFGFNPSFISGIKWSISREEFEELNDDLFEKLMGSVKTALCEAKMDKSQIDEIVLVGGSTKIPKVRILVACKKAM